MAPASAVERLFFGMLRLSSSRGAFGRCQRLPWFGSLIIFRLQHGAMTAMIHTKRER